MALLEILAMGNRQIEEGKIESAIDVVKRLRGPWKDSLMPHKVFLTADAVNDLEEIYEYIAYHDAPKGRQHVLETERTFKKPVGISRSVVPFRRNC